VLQGDVTPCELKRGLLLDTLQIATDINRVTEAKVQRIIKMSALQGDMTPLIRIVAFFYFELTLEKVEQQQSHLQCWPIHKHASTAVLFGQTPVKPQSNPSQTPVNHTRTACTAPGRSAPPQRASAVLVAT
jgi:hypothetical protein